MLFSNVHKSAGFTQLEISLVLIILGVLSAIALPSFLGWYGTKQVEEALTEFQGLLQEAQVNSIRLSGDCPITIPTGANPTISSSQSGCLSAGNQTFDGITLRKSSGLNSLTYNYLGETTLTSVETVVLSNSNNGGQQKCLVIAGPIGLSRIGTYLASDTAGTNAANCNSPQ